MIWTRKMRVLFVLWITIHVDKTFTTKVLLQHFKQCQIHFWTTKKEEIMLRIRSISMKGFLRYGTWFVGLGCCTSPENLVWEATWNNFFKTLQPFEIWIFAVVYSEFDLFSPSIHYADPVWITIIVEDLDDCYRVVATDLGRWSWYRVRLWRRRKARQILSAEGRHHQHTISMQRTSFNQRLSLEGNCVVHLRQRMINIQKREKYITAYQASTHKKEHCKD